MLTLCLLGSKMLLLFVWYLVFYANQRRKRQRCVLFLFRWVFSEQEENSERDNILKPKFIMYIYTHPLTNGKEAKNSKFILYRVCKVSRLARFFLDRLQIKSIKIFYIWWHAVCYVLVIWTLASLFQYDISSFLIRAHW